ncbi:DUF6344 domain-containing protein [Streptomyces sp. NPDC006540]|uniref:DUF6344 domain-containing protein n=1 Tax=Streptomyces sp. NPDC006540 TaxID=3155353 RepID=UPI00339EFD57
MATFKVRNLWNAFITAFFALLASVGLTTAAATAQPAAQSPEEPADAARPKALRATVPAQTRRQVTWLAPRVRDRSLPPTMKQRISAEAHGSSPAVRHLSGLDTSGANPVAPYAGGFGPAASPGIPSAAAHVPAVSPVASAPAAAAGSASRFGDSPAMSTSTGADAQADSRTAPSGAIPAAQSPADASDDSSVAAPTGASAAPAASAPVSHRALSAVPTGSPADAVEDSAVVLTADFAASRGDQGDGPALLAA